MTIAIDAPLTVWYCDECDGPIVRTSESVWVDGTPGNVPAEKTGVITWNRPQVDVRENTDQLPERTLAVAYKVVHKRDCDFDRKGSSWETDLLLGTEGLLRWSELLWNGPDNEPYRFAPGTTLSPTLDLLFRFQVPYYEQARRYLSTEAARSLMGGRIVMDADDWQQVIKEGGREVAGY